MSDNSPQQKKESVLKSLAILGLLTAVIVIAWSSVQLVRILPEAFTSLASLAKSVSPTSLSSHNDDEVLTLTSNVTLTNAGEPVTISWAMENKVGEFIFSYRCAEGIAIDLQNIEKFKSITCDTPYNIGSSTSLTFTVDSEKKRYADVWYTLSFIAINDTMVRASSTAQLTIINSAISSSDLATTTPETTVTTPPVVPTTPITAVQPDVVTPPTINPAPTPAKPEIIYVMPVSDPRGRTDLGAKYLHVGTIIKNKFVQQPVQQDEAGAIQFEIKNYGTKTSDSWTYSVTLPDKTTYTSKAQVPLKPNERAVLTLSFPATNVRSHTFVVKVHESTDKVPKNNSFTQTITFVK